MASKAVSKRRRELQAEGLGYTEALAQAVTEVEAERNARVRAKIIDQPDRTPDIGASPPVPVTHETSHGARSAQRVNAVAEQFLELVRDDYSCTYITSNVAFRPALERWAMAEARVSLYAQWLDTHDDITDKDARYAAEMLRLWTARAEKACQALGLDPASRARLGSDLASMMKVRTEYDPDIEELIGLALGGDVLSKHDEVWTEDGEFNTPVTPSRFK